MTPLGLNLVLAILWCLVTGAFTPWNFIAGVLIGIVIVSGISAARGHKPYILRILNFTRFGMYFIRILIQSNWIVARAAISPGNSMTPRIIRYPVDGLTHGQKLALSSAITLTPGTLTVDICPDGKWLYLHCMFAENRGRTIADIDDLADKMRKWVFAC